MKESHKSCVCIVPPGVETRSDAARGRARAVAKTPRALITGMAADISEWVAGSTGYCMANVSVKLPPAPRTNRPLKLVDETLILKKP